MSSSASRLPVAYVMDSDPQALSVVRNLSRHGVRVVMLTYKPHSPGRFTRHATAQVLPRLDEHPDIWLAHLLKEGAAHRRRSVLFPATDRYVEFVSKHREALDPYFVIPLPPREVLEAIMDKRRQYLAAKAAHVPMPNTIFPVEEADLRATQHEEWTFPCVLKPAAPHRWIRAYGDGSKMRVTRSYEELVSGFRDAKSRGLDLIVQELIPGGPERLHSLYFYANAQGVVVGGVGRKLRQFPVSTGNGTLRVSVKEPRIVEAGTKFIQAMSFYGSGNVEFREDPRDGQFKLMELNTRTALGEEVLIASGLPLPYIAYRDLIGEPLPRQQGSSDYATGVKWWYFETDFQAYKAMRREGRLTTWAWLRSIWGAKSFAHFAWDDPKPFVVGLRTFIWKYRQGKLS